MSVAGSQDLTDVMADDQPHIEMAYTIDLVPIAGRPWPVALLLAGELLAGAVALPLALLPLARSSKAKKNGPLRVWIWDVGGRRAHAGSPGRIGEPLWGQRPEPAIGARMIALLPDSIARMTSSSLI